MDKENKEKYVKLKDVQEICKGSIWFSRICCGCEIEKVLRQIEELEGTYL